MHTHAQWGNLGRVQLGLDNVPLSTSGYKHCSVSRLTHAVLILTLPCSHTANDHESPMSAGAEYKQKWKTHTHTHSMRVCVNAGNFGLRSAHLWRSCAPIKRQIVKESENDRETEKKKKRGVCFSAFLLLPKNGKLLHTVPQICPQLHSKTHPHTDRHTNPL